jgi:hypothetical protein
MTRENYFQEPADDSLRMSRIGGRGLPALMMSKNKQATELRGRVVSTLPSFPGGPIQIPSRRPVIPTEIFMISFNPCRQNPG